MKEISNHNTQYNAWYKLIMIYTKNIPKHSYKQVADFKIAYFSVYGYAIIRD